MSIATEHLGQRLIEPASLASSSAAAPMATMASLTRGQRGLIHDVCDQADPATARRLFDLGFAPGVEVEMLRQAPLADPVVFRVAGYDIALRRAQARCIQVTTTP